MTSGHCWLKLRIGFGLRQRSRRILRATTPEFQYNALPPRHCHIGHGVSDVVAEM
jgi:hypothetical protein